MAEKSKKPGPKTRKTSARRKPAETKKSRASGAETPEKARRKPRKQPAAKKRRSVIGLLASWTLVAMIWGSVAVGGALVWYGWDLPDIDEAVAEGRRPAVTVLAGDGSRIVSFGDVFGLPVQ